MKVLFKIKYWTIFPTLFCVVFIIAAVGSAFNQQQQFALSSSSSTSSIDVSSVLSYLPSFITEEMVIAALESQSTYGYPASVCIAQVIGESGFGMYGPGGENGQGLSQLAYDYKNLFGIKYFSSDQYATGSIDFSTNEEYTVGSSTTITAGFAIYPSYTACIEQRSWMLSYEPYASHVAPYINSNDGHYTKEQANGFATGIKEGGWATSSTYVENLISHMENYNLYSLDNMTVEQYKNYDNSILVDNENLTEDQIKVRDIAMNDLGTYPCTSQMCGAWVSGVFDAAGLPYPTGDAIDFWNKWSYSGSTSMENIPVGAVVVGSGTGYMGSLFGHVGIYIGDGLVANNVGYLSIETVEQWASWQSATCQGHTGWIGWVWANGQPLN